MNELIDFKKIWNRANELWRTRLGSILLGVVFFFFGMEVQEKSITDDCKFAKAFRDGATVYECQIRLVR